MELVTSLPKAKVANGPRVLTCINFLIEISYTGSSRMIHFRRTIDLDEMAVLQPFKYHLVSNSVL